ncbi:MAG: hypothetical protein IKB07_11485 [Lachnospiraceae bacterium]|nr:hypothetical protein [Lachnospiraceae bacterium]
MPFLIFLVLCILWVLWVKFGPNHSDLISDFQRIKRLKDNIAYQVTGRVDGKDPGVLRYEEE